MRKPLLALSVALGVCFLATAVWAACNVTDDTYISTDTVLTANETPCQVDDAGNEGVVIINGSSIGVTCAPGFNLTGSGPVGIYITGGNVNLSGCEVKGYTTDIRSLFGYYNIFTGNVFGSMSAYGVKNTIRNNTFNSLYLGHDANYTLVENNMVFGGIHMEHGGDTGFHQIINNIIRTAGNGITVTAGLGGIPDVIRGNDIAGSPKIGTNCIYTNIGANSLTIENNNFSCDSDLNGNPYTGIRNTISGNDFRGNRPISWDEIDTHGPSSNLFWNNRFWNTFTIPGTPWPGYGENVWNATTTAGTNIIGGSWIAGNWWGDYAGEDLDGDGIGDTDLPFKGDYAPLLLPPITHEDCNMAGLTVNAGETVNVRRCTITGTVNLTKYGRLYINDSSVGDIIGSADTVLRMHNVTSSGTTTLAGTAYITDCDLGDATLNGNSTITGGTLGDTAIGGNAAITDATFGVVSITGTAAINGMTAPNLTLTGSGMGGTGIAISGTTTVNGNSNNLAGTFGDFALNGNDNTIAGINGALSLSGTGNTIKNANVNNPSLGEGNTIRDSTITGGMEVSAKDSGIINNNISGTDDCLGWVPSGICLVNEGGTNARVINNTITITSSGSVRGLDSGFTNLENAEISGNKFRVSGGDQSTCMYAKGSHSKIADNDFDCALGTYGTILDMVTGTDNTVTGNTIKGAKTLRSSGIKLADYTDGDFSSNNITDCEYGVRIADNVAGNRFWNNYFHNPTGNNVWGDGAINNTWNTTPTAGTNIAGGSLIAGNWWWDYAGEDLDGNGIGDTDTPHGLDKAPLLMAPETWSDCLVNAPITVGTARSLKIRNCNITTDSITISDYGRLTIEDSKVVPSSAKWNATNERGTRLTINNSDLSNCTLQVSGRKVTISDSDLTNCDVNAGSGEFESEDSTWTGGRLNVTGANAATIEGADITYSGTGLILSGDSNGAVRNTKVGAADFSGGYKWTVSGLTADDVWWSSNNGTLNSSTISNIIRLSGGHNKLSGITARGIKITGEYNDVNYSTFSGGVDFGWSYGEGNVLAHNTIGDTIITMTQSPGHEGLKIINNTITFGSGRTQDLEGAPFGILVEGGVNAFSVLDNSVIEDNKISSSNTGVRCIKLKGADNKIKNNELNCESGITLGWDLPALRNNVTRNKVHGKSGLGLTHSESRDNRIWDNRFETDNNAGASDGADINANYWNATKTNASELNTTNIIGGPFIAGNWWSDYGGVDADGDGIGDTVLPHKGAPKQKDWLPLTNARPQGPGSGGGGGGFVPGNETDKKDKPSGCTEGKIPICHATSSETNPYNFLCVSENAADGNGKNDHSHHAGDIIPVTDTNNDGTVDQGDCPTTFYYEDKKKACNSGCKEGEKEEIDLEKTPVFQIILTPSKNVQGLDITIKQLPEKPSEVDEQKGKVYQYIKIDKNITNDEIKEAVLKFIVDRDWLEANGLNPDKIKMVRWNGGKWEKLPTEREEGNDEEYFTLDGDTAVVGKDGTVTIKVLGAAITSGAGGKDIPVYAWDKINNGKYSDLFGGADVNKHKAAGYYSQEIDVKDGDSINLKAKGSLTIDTESGGDNVIALRNGDTPPDFKPFDNQPDIRTFLSSVMDPKTGKVSIGPNDILYLFELGSTDKKSSAFDMQDFVVLVSYETTAEDSFTYAATSEGFSYFAIVSEEAETTGLSAETGPTGAFTLGAGTAPVVGGIIIIIATGLVLLRRRGSPRAPRQPKLAPAYQPHWNPKKRGR